MRFSLLRLYLEDMEVLIAEEALLNLDITAIGSGNMTTEAAEERITKWAGVVAGSHAESAPVLPPAPGSLFERHTPDEVGRQLEQSGWEKVANPYARQPPDPSNPIS